MAEYIERQKIRDKILFIQQKRRDDGQELLARALDIVLFAIDKIPAADVAPVKRGRWENYPSDMSRRCSVGKVEYEKPRFNIRANFCPDCGADMRGE